jgi:glyoxylase-like metal-dependent hydrolase (beta-lactamase superfamily II)
MALRTWSLTLGPFETNAFLFACERTREAAVVDVGFEPERMIAAIREHGLTVRYLLNTHAHYDHVAAMRDLQEAIGGEYWLHPDDGFLLEGLDRQAAMFGLPLARAPESYQRLFDGQVIQLGDERLSVIHTPGHTPGSVTFRHGDDLWAGDVLFASSIGRTDMPGGSFEVLAHTIRHKLFPLGDALRVHPGHGPDTTLGAERRFNPFVGENALKA